MAYNIAYNVAYNVRLQRSAGTAQNRDSTATAVPHGIVS